MAILGLRCMHGQVSSIRPPARRLQDGIVECTYFENDIMPPFKYFSSKVGTVGSMRPQVAVRKSTAAISGATPCLRLPFSKRAGPPGPQRRGGGVASGRAERL